MKVMNLDTHYTAAEKVAQILKSKGFDAYIIGGAVRDLLLGHPPKDYDLVTNATPDELLSIAEFIDPKYTDSAQAYGVTRIKINVNDQDIDIEITTYRRDIEAHLGRKLTKVEFSDLIDDVNRRDFTINSLALDPLNHCLVDLLDGVKDLDNRFVRFIGNPTARIQEDPLRVLRAIRFKNRLGFRYNQATYDAISTAIKSDVLSEIAVDRLRNELSSMLRHSSRQEALEDLDNLGAISAILPELASTKGIAQPHEFHTEGDVFNHSLLAVHYLPAEISVRLAWATLLHDIGKTPTFTPAEITGDRIRFDNHHSEGAKRARKVMQRLNFSTKLTDEISWMIHYHMAIAYLPEMRPGHAITFMSHPAFEDLLELHRADAHAAWNKLPDGGSWTDAPNLSIIEQMYSQYIADRNAKKAPSLKDDLGIDGTWLKTEFNLSDGEQIGHLLEELRLLYHEGKLPDKQVAKSTIKNILDKS